MVNDKIIAYTDGGCISNPGGRGGYGVVLLQGNNMTEISQGYESTTNNRMELMAMLAIFENIDDESNIIIYSDSKYAIGVATGEMQACKNLDLIEPLRKEVQNRNVEFYWVKGHNKNTYNERCDQLATAAMEAFLVKDGGYES